MRIVQLDDATQSSALSRGTKSALERLRRSFSSKGLDSSAGLRVSEVAQEYRRKARECTEMAARVVDPADKAAWLGLAEGWLKLAQQVSSLLSDFPSRK